MKAISTGNEYKIYDDSLRTYDKLPPQVYSVCFSQLSGFSLAKHADIEVHEDKIYGVHMRKVSKVLSSFNKFERSLGVILSGDKGIGKSLFAKILSIRAIDEGLPVIIVDTYIPGIVSFIESIEQDAVYLFDEFDKTFVKRRRDDNLDPQTELLSLFDGMSQGKRLYVITCNELLDLNDFLLNRPGRFHYHFRFDYPSPNEVREYLQDKLQKEYWNSIEDVVNFSGRINLNYDCLRAIAFELNNGEDFKTAITDLNIVNIDAGKYNLVLHYSNGITATAKNIRLDLFDTTDGYQTYYFYDQKGNNFVDVTFDLANMYFDTKLAKNVIHGNALALSYEDYNDEELAKFVASVKEADVLYLSFERQAQRNIHYAL